LFVSRARPRTVIIYTLTMAIILAVLPSLVPIDLPTGLMSTVV
jgi:putative tricarboxylic transport membrane protein